MTAMIRIPRLAAFVISLLVAVATTAADASSSDRPLWLAGGRPTQQAIGALDLLSDAERYGLSPADYATRLSPIAVQLILAGEADAELYARFDAALTRSVSSFVTHVHGGRVSAEAAGFHLPYSHSAFDATAATRQLATATDVAGALATFEPRPRPYRLLKQALARYRDLARQPELNRLPPLPQRSVTIGDDYAGAPRLRALLVALGDLDAAAVEEHGNESSIDAALGEGIRRFQDRHGLAPDGVIGQGTFAALTTPLTDRVRQIELTLERWRWLAFVPRPDIVINIPQFMLYALPEPSRGQQPAIEMPVIVGRSHTSTPVFIGAIEEVIFHPYWDVPASIVRKELLPQIRKNVAYLERHHFEIVRGAGDDATAVEPTPEAIDALAAGRLRLRQRPGPDNALGPVKFVVPNPYDVRLHGTPEQQLFTRSSRAFSHGCIRVSDPAALAEYILKNASGNWDTAAVEAAICGTQTLHIKLKKPMRVVVFYATAAATESRGVLFSEDIYGHDRKLQKLLALQTRL
jgi:murein L,D-transpeptidase YcbB/YkuD